MRHYQGITAIAACTAVIGVLWVSSGHHHRSEKPLSSKLCAVWTLPQYSILLQECILATQGERIPMAQHGRQRLDSAHHCWLGEAYGLQMPYRLSYTPSRSTRSAANRSQHSQPRQASGEAPSLCQSSTSLLVLVCTALAHYVLCS